MSPDGWAMLAIAAMVVVAHLLFVLDLSDPNPIGPRSGTVTATAVGFLGGGATIDPNNGFTSQALGTVRCST